MTKMVNWNMSDRKSIVVENRALYTLESQSELQNTHIVTQSKISVRTSPAAVEAVDPVVKRKRLRESKVWWKKGSSYTISGVRTAPPCGGSHPETTERTTL